MNNLRYDLGVEGKKFLIQDAGSSCLGTGHIGFRVWGVGLRVKDLRFGV